MAGLLDFLIGGQGGGGLLGMGQHPIQIDPNQFAAAAQQPRGLFNGGGLMGGLYGALDALSDPQGMQRQHALENYIKLRQLQLNEQAGNDFLKDFGPAVGAPGMPPRPTLTPQPGQQQPASNFGNAIAGIESGGKYDALGPVTKTGDRAYGKYQVMGANVGPWTQEVFGKAMSPEEFAANPQAQDAVFNAKFGQYVQKYGPEGAARAWFAGEGGMNDPNRKDQLGTSVAAYGQKFASALGPQAATPQAPVPTQAAPQGMAPNAQSLRDLPMPVLFRWLANPNLQPQYREVVKKLFDAKVDDMKITDKQKDYYKAQGDKAFANFVNPPSFGNTGQRDQYDRPIEGWRNQNDLTVSPPIVAGAQQPTNPGAPLELVDKLRNDVQSLPSYKNITQAAPVYDSMMKSAKIDNRGADVDLIYGFAKLMDPGSVVRESEMTMAQAVATLPQALQSKVMSQLTGSGRLSQSTRTEIMEAAHNRMTSYSDRYVQDSKMYRGIAERRNMNVSDVIQNFGEFPKYTPSTPIPQPEAVQEEMRRRGLIK